MQRTGPIRQARWIPPNVSRDNGDRWVPPLRTSFVAGRIRRGHEDCPRDESLPASVFRHIAKPAESFGLRRRSGRRRTLELPHHSKPSNRILRGSIVGGGKTLCRWG